MIISDLFFRTCEEKIENKICQSCGMPITSNKQLSTNKDRSINVDYCKYCYENGEFIDKVTKVTMEGNYFLL